MLFKDRKDAGRLLSEKLLSFKDAKNTIVIGIPRGGVVVAKQVSQALHLPLDVTCPRKIGAPGNPEFAIGAVTETGEPYFDTQVLTELGISQEYLDDKVAEETDNARARLRIFRRGLPIRMLKGKTIILVDDGLATGATMKAAIVSLRAEKAKTVIAAVPISPPETAEEIAMIADQFICLSVEKGFFAVGQFYQNFGETTNDDVLALLSK